MRIVLVRPNSYILPTAPPMGLASLAAWLKLKRGDDIFIIDGRKERLSHKQLAERVAAISPDVLGIGALSAESKDAHLAISAAKKITPHIKVIMGGPHASATPEKTLADGDVDFVVSGEGEESLRELLDRLEKGETNFAIPGVWSRVKNEIVFGGDREPLDVDVLPVPAWDLLPIENYFKWGRNSHDTVPESNRTIQIMTSRGCPFRCIYCHGLFGRSFRPRTSESVIAEAKYLVDKFDLKAIEICDDIFNLDILRAKEILKGLAKFNIALSFPNGVRADHVDDELLDLMESAGARRVSFAVESASPRVQKLIRKGLDLNKAREIIEKASSRKFLSTGFFILGFPDETQEEMMETIRFACESDLHIASFFYLTPFPGTESAQIAQSKGVNCEDPLKGYSTLQVNLSAVSDDVLREMRKKAYREFYLNPKRIWRTLSLAPKSRRTFINALKIFLLSIKDSVDY